MCESGQRVTTGRRLLAIGVTLLVSGTAVRSALSAVQTSFDSADAAVAALVDAVAANDDKRLLAILGPGSERLLASGDRSADLQSRRAFTAAYTQHHGVLPGPGGRMTLVVGTDDWALPIPIVSSAGTWRFDSSEGAQELVNRRIGRNEIAAIRVALTYVDAQSDYFTRMEQSTGHGEYARRLISTPGTQDGLYWPAAESELQSPLAPLVAQAVDQGYPGEIRGGGPIPYQGYYFKVLKSQGENAAGGARRYVVADSMTGGFALLAWPAIYSSSGIMSFEVNQDGIVFQKDLGGATATHAARIESFNPDLTWARVELVGP